MAEQPGKRTIIIGAGPAGLSALRYCSLVTEDAILFDAKAEVGGTWVLEEHS